MRTIIVFAFALLFAAITALSLSGTVASAAAPTPAKKAQCEANKKSCMAAGVQTGIYGERYVPPDIVKQCYEAYHTCMGQN
jgi:hypothetical protein